MMSLIGNNGLDCIEISDLRRKPFQRLIHIVPQLAHFLKIPEEVMGGRRCNDRYDTHQWSTASIHPADPRALPIVILHGEESLGPKLISAVLLRQKPDLMPFGKPFQCSADGVTERRWPKRLRFRKGFLRPGIGNSYWVSTVLPCCAYCGPQRIASDSLRNRIERHCESITHFLPLVVAAFSPSRSRSHKSASTSSHLRRRNVRLPDGSHPTRLASACVSAAGSGQQLLEGI